AACSFRSVQPAPDVPERLQSRYSLAASTRGAASTRAAGEVDADGDPASGWGFGDLGRPDRAARAGCRRLGRADDRLPGDHAEPADRDRLPADLRGRAPD